jgi:hypothetical protein
MMKINIEFNTVTISGKNTDEVFNKIRKIYGEKFKKMELLSCKKIGCIAKVYL